MGEAQAGGAQRKEKERMGMMRAQNSLLRVRSILTDGGDFATDSGASK